MTTAFKIRFLRQLNKLAAQADRQDIKLANGAEVGCMLGTMAAELQITWNTRKEAEEAAKKYLDGKRR